MYFFDENDIYYRHPAGAPEAPAYIRLRIKLRRGDASGARVRLFPDAGHPVDIVMEYSRAVGSYDEYECEFCLESPGLFWYYFLVSAKGDRIINVPEDGDGKFQITVCSGSAFSQDHVPADHASQERVPADHASPGWIKGGLIYHIFVDRFKCGGELRLRPGAVYRPDWGGCPDYLPDERGIVRNNDFFGGNLYGIIEKLPYLEELGVTCIYLSPVFDAASNHKYDTSDFMHIDPGYGGDEAIVQLCNEAGQRGIAIVLDGVFNHVGADSIYFNKYGSHDAAGAYQGSHSRYYDWFTFKEGGKYDAWWGIELLPALNKKSSDYRDFICGDEGVIAHWTRAGISGWRLDVVDELPDVFLYPLCAAIKREKSDALIVGEVWEDASNKISYDVRRRYFLGGQLDSVTNYPLKDAIIGFVKRGEAEELASLLASQRRNYPEGVRHSLMNVLGTHDTVRILTALSDVEPPADKRAMEWFKLDNEQRSIAADRLMLAATLQFTLPGVPCVFYGDEAGMEGCADPFNRRCYPWGGEDAELMSWYKDLSRLRKAHGCFRDGEYTLVEARDGLFAFTRGEGAERILVAVNASDTDRALKAEGFSFDTLCNAHVDSLIVKAGKPGIFACDA